MRSPRRTPNTATIAAVAALVLAAGQGLRRWQLPAQPQTERLADPEQREGALAAILLTGPATAAPEATTDALVALLAEPRWRQRAIACLGEIGPRAEAAALPLAQLLPELEGIALVRALVALRKIYPPDDKVIHADGTGYEAAQAALAEYRQHSDPLVRLAAESPIW